MNLILFCHQLLVLLNTANLLSVHKYAAVIARPLLK